MSQKLKPCPFCGSKPVIVGQDADYYYNGFLSVFAHCGTCQASAPGDGYLTRADAASAWNYRAYGESPRERFRREYRKARLTGPFLTYSAPAAYALLSLDKMTAKGSINVRLAVYKMRKKAGL